MKSSVLSEEKMKTALGEDYSTVEKTVEEGLSWLDSDSSYTKEDYESKQKEIENILSPLVQKAYAASAGSSVPDESIPEVPETQEDNSSSNEPHIEEID